MKTTKEKIAVMQAFEDGKPIEFRDPARKDSLWTKTINPSWSWDDTDYRVAEEPKLRPWKPEEVPVGACVKDPKYPHVWLITAVHKGMAYLNGGDTAHRMEYFTDDKMLYSIDHGKTWQPCGVLE